MHRSAVFVGNPIPTVVFILSVNDHGCATAGPECRTDAGVLDEIPGAYKDIDPVMAAQSDPVQVITTLRQVVTVKG